ncbi:hypothetical protein TTRE_0000540301 [Trichuris trichiura]|uniref:Uncharacterized protein n=1 Tax=Trichuris trichiura TaxID=36087 RepID=A0A077ZA57_TRITR|nr:hypothetical protein TTRE_0000540301 [Trichuris trichiura]
MVWRNQGSVERFLTLTSSLSREIKCSSGGVTVTKWRSEQDEQPAELSKVAASRLGSAKKSVTKISSADKKEITMATDQAGRPPSKSSSSDFSSNLGSPETSWRMAREKRLRGSDIPRELEYLACDRGSAK